MRKKPAPSRLSSAAYHEAGHAVMCHLMHLRIRSVGIASEGFYAGQTTHENPFHAGKRKIVDTIRARLQAEKAIMVCLAGALAQRKYAPRDPNRDYGGAMDVDTASNLALGFFRSRKTAAAYMMFAEEWVRQKLEEPRTWAAVERLAHALLQQQKISGRQAEAIICGRYADLRGKSGGTIHHRKTT